MATDREPGRATIEGMTDADLKRVHALLRKIGGPHVSWGAASVLDVWLAESRLEAERLALAVERSATRRILTATWVLAAATVALVLATVGLIVVGG